MCRGGANIWLPDVLSREGGRHFALATILTLAACAAPASNAGAMLKDPATGAAQGSGMASAAPSGEPQWGHPSAPDVFKFMATDLVSGEPVDGTNLIGKSVVMWFWA